MRHVGRTDTKIQGVEQRFTELIERAIQQTRRVESEAQEEISMSSVLIRLIEFLKRYGEYQIHRMLSHPMLRHRFPRNVLMEGLEILQRNELVALNGPLDDPKTIVTFRKQVEENKTQVPNHRLLRMATGAVCCLKFIFHITAATAKPRVQPSLRSD